MGDDGNAIPFTARVGDDPKHGGKPPEPGDDSEQVAPGDIYATVTGQRLALSLEFIRKDGRSFSVPYSYLPLLWWKPPGSLMIEYPHVFTVVLHGRELDELHRRIRDHRITWIREIDERRAAALSSAVTRIEIINVYPSRQAAGT